MKTKVTIFNRELILRAVLVGVISVVVCLIGGWVLAVVVDIGYRQTGSEALLNIFHFFSYYRIVITAVAAVIGMVLFSGWICTPLFNQVSKAVLDGLVIQNGDIAPIALPKAFGEVEENLNRVNLELQLWKYAMQEAEQRKDDLVVYLAHDIRTPLTSVLGYLELLQETPDLPLAQREKFIEIALRKAKRMQLLVEELFEVTRFNIGNIELEKTQVNAPMMMNQLVEEIAPLTSSRNLTVSIQPNEVQNLFIDPEKMARAIDNILHNAVYYTPAGGEVTIQMAQTENGQVRIDISNTGSEIAQEKLERFFEKFYRGDEARQSGTGGSGLGLAIAKSVVEAHGGSIAVKNENAVTTFTIVL